MKSNYIKTVLIFAITTLFFTSNYGQRNENPRNQSDENQFTTANKGVNDLILLKEEESYSLKKTKAIFNKKLKAGKEDKFVQIKSKTDAIGFVHQKYQQQFKGIDVEFATYTLHAKNGMVKSMSGEYHKIKNINHSPTLTPEQGLARAIEHIAADAYLWEDEKHAGQIGYEKPKGELVILPDLDSENAEGEIEVFNLAYKYDIYATSPISRGMQYIDAHTGAPLFYNATIKHLGEHANCSANTGSVGHICGHTAVKKTFRNGVVGFADTKYSGRRPIETTRRNDGNFILRDNTRGSGINTYNSQGLWARPQTDFVDNNNNWSTAEYDNAAKDNAALDAHWGAEQTYDYFLTVHGQNSYDGNGAAINSYVHYGQNWDNATWNGSAMSYGDGSSNGNEGNGDFDALTTIDIVAHEMGHAITDSSANLAYRRESGALNEGFSDIWGAAVEHFAKGNGDDADPSPEIWLIGEEMDRRNGSIALRSMSNPKARNQPDTYRGLEWRAATAAEGCAFPIGDSQSPWYNDYCGVHTNSGVLNHWFYLVTVGSEATDEINDNGAVFNVNGIGMTRAAAIAYRTLTVYLGPNSTFFGARIASIQSAKDLYGAESAEVIAVTNAWYAVGVGAEYKCGLPAPANFGSTQTTTNSIFLNWSPVPGAVSYDLTVGNNPPINVTGTSYNVTGLSSGIHYVCSVVAKCIVEGQSPFAAAVITTLAGQVNYCVANAVSSDLEYIQRVQLGTIDNQSAGGTTLNGYSDFTAISTGLAKGETYTISISPFWTSAFANEGYGVYIDYNQDGDFNDLGETVWTKSESIEIPVSGTFTIPASAKSGLTRMRVMMRYNATPDGGCHGFNYGEVEDYTLDIGSVAYCTANAQNQGEYIARVQLGTIDKSSFGGSTITGYSNFTNISTALAKGSTNTITITPQWATPYAQAYGVFIDYNQNGDFTDPGETVWTKTPSLQNPVSGSFTVPVGARNGATRMRVVMRYNTMPSSCGTFNYGEVEDYTVNIGGAGTRTNISQTLTEETEEENETFDVSVYPNPVGGNTLFVKAEQNLKYTVVNAIGQQLSRGNSSNNVDVSNLDAGVYLIQFEFNDKVETRKFIKQ